MKLDKYGDEILEERQKLGKMPRIAFLLLSLLQLVLITVNILVLVLDFLNFYVCFATVPMYVFSYIHFLNGYNLNKESFILPIYVKAVKILSPILYILTAVPAIFQLF